MKKKYFSLYSLALAGVLGFSGGMLSAQQQNQQVVSGFQDYLKMKATEMSSLEKFRNVDAAQVYQDLKNQKTATTFISHAKAGTDCDQGDNSNNFENAINITSGIQYEQADDFEVSTGNTLNIKSIELNIFAPKKINSLSFKFYQDDNGKPGAELQTVSGLVPYAQSVLGNVGGNKVYAVFVDTDLSFTEGKYWIEPLADMGGEGFAFWEMTTQGSLGAVLHTRDSGGPWTAEPSGGQAVFKLHCEHAVPPESLCFFQIQNDVEPISRVVFSDIDHTSDAAVNGSPALEDFTSVSGHVQQGQAYDIKLEGNTAGDYPDYFTAFIDWNQNGALDDAGEVYEIGALQNSTGTDGKQVLGSVNVPANAPNGSVKMRIVKNWEQSPLDPCGSYWYGQAEDYTLVVGNLAVSETAVRDFSFAPNPVKDVLRINAKKKIAGVNVYGLTGQKVLQVKKVMDGQVNISSLSAGIYVVQLTFKDGKTSQFKIIKD